jgi:SAM-dependent methyltransferase
MSEWTPDAERLYAFAADTLKAKRIRGPVLDFGAGSGRGTKMLREAGFDVTGYEQDPSIIEEAEGIAQRRYVRHYGVFNRWAAIVAFRVLGYGDTYGNEKYAMETMMREAPLVIVSIEKPNPVLSFPSGTTIRHDDPAHIILEWSR